MAEDRSLQLTPQDAALMRHKPAGEQATKMGEIEKHAEWKLLSGLPLSLTAGISMPWFKVKDLLALAPGQVVESEWSSDSDITLFCGRVQLGWAEFEVVEQRLAVRITRLA